MINFWVCYLESNSKSSRWPVGLPHRHQRAYQHSIPCLWLSSGSVTAFGQEVVSTLLSSASGFRKLKTSKGKTGSDSGKSSCCSQICPLAAT